MKFLIPFFVLLGVLGSCRSPEPREPIVKKSDHFLKESVTRNRALQEQEEKEISQIIDRDADHSYHNSQEGFWYRIDHKSKKDTLTPTFGDLVKFTYAIHSLEGRKIYSEREIGKREYMMDKENLITGLRKGLQLMSAGDRYTFYFPSSVAFGYYGDNNKIDRNTPLRITVSVDTVIPEPKQ